MELSMQEYSKRLNLSTNALNVYRVNRGLPRKTPTRVLYETYIKEREHETEIALKLQDIYYELHAKKQIFDFGVEAHKRGIITSTLTIYDFFSRCFQERMRLIGSFYMKKRIAVVKFYEEEWACKIAT